MAKLICAGHASCDIPFRTVDRNVFEVDTVFAEESKVLTGGDALNIVINMNKLGYGSHCKFVSVIGNDVFGKIILDYLRERKINTSGITIRDDCNTLVSIALIESNHERHFICHGNAPQHITVNDVISMLDPDTEHLHLGSLMSLDGLEFENLRHLFQYAHQHNIKTSFDVTYDKTNQWYERIKSGLPYTDIFFASYDEAVALSGGKTKPEAIAEFFRGKGVKTFVLKLGKDGCYATDYTQSVKLPTYEGFPVVDTTGAGDGFVTGYLYGILHGLTMEECSVLGNANGTLAVGAVGSTAGTGTLNQLIDLIRVHGAKTLDAEKLAVKLESLLA